MTDDRFEVPPMPHAFPNKAELDRQLSPSLSAKDASGVLQAWQTETEKARRHPTIKASLDISYGPAPAQKLDIYSPIEGETAGGRPIVLFIHGGFWQLGSKDASGFAAPAFTEAGCVFVAVGYTLAPNASLAAITAEIRQAVDFVQAHAGEFGGDPSRIIAVGHSAGGHLATCLVTQGVPIDDAARVAGVVPISGVFDLEPIRLSYVNDAVKLNSYEMATLSPASSIPAFDVPVMLVVGADETDEFLRQTYALSKKWTSHLTDLEVAIIPGKDHFDIVLDLAEPSSRLFQIVHRLATENKQDALQ